MEQPLLHEELRVETADGAVLAGTLMLPADSSRCRALVGVHGASLGTRDAALYRHLQALLGEHGIATLFFDRRGEGASTGEPHRAGFEELAVDVRAWLRRLRTHPRINAEQVGLWCFSQGGWISALAAAEDPATAFLIAVSPSE